MITVCCSGGYDPLHVGHLENLKAAKKLGGKLIVILTRDDQLIAKKGFVFMSYNQRKAILEELRCVDVVAENIDQDTTSTESLRLYKPQIFCKGGDRTPENMPQSELDVCREIGCEIIYGVGGEKIESSSRLVVMAKQKIPAGRDIE